MKSLLSQIRNTKSDSLSVISAPVKYAGIGLFSLAFLTAIWAVTAKIPIKINAVGILTPVDGLFIYRAQASGRLLYPLKKDKNNGGLEFESPTWSNKAYNFIYSDSDPTFAEAQQIGLQILDYVNNIDTVRIPFSAIGAGVGSGGDYQVALNAKDIVAIVDVPSLRQNLKDSLLSTEKSISNYKTRLTAGQQNLEVSSRIAKAKRSMIEPMAGLKQEGFVSKVEFLQAAADAASQQKQVGEIRQQLDAVKLQLEQDKLKLVQAVTDYVQQSVIFSHDNAYIKSFLASQWEYVNPGLEVTAVSWSQNDDPSLIPIFYDQKSATEIAVGQKVILTPLGFSIAEVGGIVGEVVSIEPFPYTVAALTQKLKSQGLAQMVSPSGASYIANVRLARTDSDKLRDKVREHSRLANNDNRLFRVPADQSPDTTGGYQWNNKTSPPLTPREGFMLSAQVTTRTVTPLQMIIPFLKQLSGQVPMSKLIHTQINQP